MNQKKPAPRYGFGRVAAGQHRDEELLAVVADHADAVDLPQSALGLRGSQPFLTAGRVPAFLPLPRQGAYAEPVPGPRLPCSLLMIIQNVSRTELLSDEGAAGQWARLLMIVRILQPHCASWPPQDMSPPDTLTSTTAADMPLP